MKDLSRLSGKNVMKTILATKIALVGESKPYLEKLDELLGLYEIIW
jgi:hypothetical protein